MRRLLFVTVVVLALAPHAAAAVDPMSWTSYGYDNQLGNAIQTKTLTQEAVRRLQLSWSAQLDGPVYSAQSVIRDADQKVGNGITAWHADPGCGFRPIWSRSLGDGSQATPLVVGSTVFATGGRPGSFYGLRAGTGDVLWSYPTEGRTVAAMISVAGGVFGADTAGVLYAFDPAPTPRGTGSPARFPN